MSVKNIKNVKAVIFLIFALFSIILLGLIYLSTVKVVDVSSVSYASWLLIAYAAGLSMIFLPCTLPLVFIIVPLCMGKGYKKGLLMAILFGSGLTITIAVYGIVLALVGKTTGIEKASMFMFLIAGIAAYIFGTSEIKLLKFKMPFYSKAPRFIQQKSDYLKSLFMGLFLGNAGVGCPNPFFYLLMIYIMGTGSIVIGSSLGVIHGIGRALPLLLLAALAIFGVNLTQGVVKKRIAIEKIMGFVLIFLGAFLIVNGIPGGHEWYEKTLVHEGWNKIVASLGFPAELEMGMHEHPAKAFEKFAPLALFFLIIIPLLIYVKKAYKYKKKLMEVSRR